MKQPEGEQPKWLVWIIPILLKSPIYGYLVDNVDNKYNILVWKGVLHHYVKDAKVLPDYLYAEYCDRNDRQFVKDMRPTDAPEEIRRLSLSDSELEPVNIREHVEMPSSIGACIIQDACSWPCMIFKRGEYDVELEILVSNNIYPKLGLPFVLERRLPEIRGFTGGSVVLGKGIM